MPTGPANTEIEWLFTLSEADMVPRSNYYETIDPRGRQHARDTVESRVLACTARRVILSWLAQLTLPHAGVLQAAYEARPWPLSFREALGRATGIVVRLKVAEVGLPETQHDLEILEIEIAHRLNHELMSGGKGALGDLPARAETLLRAAFRAYESARGATRPLLHGVSR